MPTATLPRSEVLKSEYALTLTELQEIRTERNRPEADALAKLADIEAELAEADAEAKRVAVESYIPTAKSELGAAARNLNAALEYFRNAALQLEDAVRSHDATVSDVSMTLRELSAAAPDSARVNTSGPFLTIDASSVRIVGTDIATEVAVRTEDIYRRAGFGVVADSLASIRRGGNRLQTSPFIDCYGEGES